VIFYDWSKRKVSPDPSVPAPKFLRLPAFAARAPGVDAPCCSLLEPRE
jgi:hypothetical protein